MNPFTTLTAIAAPLPNHDIDTDLIFPGRFLSTVSRAGLGPLLFAGLRYDAEGAPRADFVLNQDPYRTAQILVTGHNFGCGSSREHAPWALLDFGVRCVISTGFADIFAGNCVKNGILLVTLGADEVALLMADAAAGRVLTVDLVAQRISRESEETIDFEVAPAVRETLLSGMDEISQTMDRIDEIAAFEINHRRRQAWL